MAKRRITKTKLTLTQGLEFSEAKDLGEIPVESPHTAEPNTAKVN